MECQSHSGSFATHHFIHSVKRRFGLPSNAMPIVPADRPVVSNVSLTGADPGCCPYQRKLPSGRRGPSQTFCKTVTSALVMGPHGVSLPKRSDAFMLHR